MARCWFGGTGSSSEGTRPLRTWRFWALVGSQRHLGIPKRTAVGFDLNRPNLLVAVLTKRAGLERARPIFMLLVGGGTTGYRAGRRFSVYFIYSFGLQRTPRSPQPRRIQLKSACPAKYTFREPRVSKKRVGEGQTTGTNLGSRTSLLEPQQAY